jgi:1-pyrroline-5-carboxylate dehydrogenase
MTTMSTTDHHTTSVDPRTPGQPRRADATGDRVTYATLAAGQTEEFQRGYDDAIERVRRSFGRRHGHWIDGQEVLSDREFEDRNPSDRRVHLGSFPAGSPADVDRAVRSASVAYDGWSRRSWADRVAIIRTAADLIESRGFDLAALVSLEAGKSRLEAMGEVTETAELARYYCDQLDHNNGFDQPMARFSPEEHTRSTLRPYGVWGVISPFNFPFALSGGPVSAALVAGNTAVLKPSSDTPMTGLALYEIFRQAGVPAGALHIVFGDGSIVGAALASHALIGGLLFTGSKAVGMSLAGQLSREYPRPCITEMGGKNPAIVMDSADLELAAEGVMRSAFGLQGQKCSACSRVYVHRSVKEEFLARLVEQTGRIAIGDPSRHGIFFGPLINERAYRNYQVHAETASRSGRILVGGGLLTDGALGHGHFVAPTIVDALPKDHPLFRTELFVPILCVAAVNSFAEAIDAANDSEYGLTAGLFSGKAEEIDEFRTRIQAGVIYINRRAGATTGAWPGVQPFGGWKGSGSSGKGSGGPYYVQQFMREQSITMVQAADRGAPRQKGGAGD